jgi:hypothetical protein
MKTVFFAWLSDDFRDTIIDFRSFYRSFKYFHPDIELIIFDDKTINEVFNSENWLSKNTCKAAFAKRLYNDYDLVVNVDADFYFFDRCHEILVGDYDVAACANFNQFWNTEMQGGYKLDNYTIPRVDHVHYMQAGLVASTSKEFWNEYYDTTRDLWDKLPLVENDTLNIVFHNGRYKTKVLDGDYDFRSPKFTQYYNCASLGRESQFQFDNGTVKLDGKPVRSYHIAHGNMGAKGPYKKRVHELFNNEISHWFYNTVTK